MELDNYINMDQEDLENLNIYLTNILIEREKKLIEAIENRNLYKLQDALKDNKKLKLSKKAWEILSFKEISKNDIDFFFYVRSLPEYKNYDKSSSLSGMSLTEQALIEGMYQKDLFDIFINHSELSNKFHNIIEWAAVSDDVSTDVIKELFEKKLIKITDEFRCEIINCGYDNYIKYFLENDKYGLTIEEYKIVYLNNWNTIFDNPILKKIKEQFPEYKNIPLLELLETLDINENRSLDSKYRKLIGLNDNLLFNILETHPFDEQSIFYMLELFDERPFHFNEKFKKFIELIIEKLPEHIPSLKNGKNLVQSIEIKPMFEKLLNFAELKNDLNTQGINPKKLKI
jgi:transcriptional regulator CtsR